MKSSADIIVEHTSEEGGIDFDACVAAFMNVPTHLKAKVHPLELMQVLQSHNHAMQQTVATIVLTALWQIGAVASVDDELDNLKLAQTFDLQMRTYDLMASKDDSGLVVPGR